MIHQGQKAAEFELTVAEAQVAGLADLALRMMVIDGVREGVAECLCGEVLQIASVSIVCTNDRQSHTITHPMVPSIPKETDVVLRFVRGRDGILGVVWRPV